MLLSYSIYITHPVRIWPRSSFDSRSGHIAVTLPDGWASKNVAFSVQRIRSSLPLVTELLPRIDTQFSGQQG